MKKDTKVQAHNFTFSDEWLKMAQEDQVLIHMAIGTTKEGFVSGYFPKQLPVEQRIRILESMLDQLKNGGRKKLILA